MFMSHATAYRYVKALFIGPFIAASLYACSDSSSSGSADAPPAAGLEHAAGTVTGDATWGPGNHTVDGTITFVSGTLTIQGGATVVMNAAASGGTSLLFGKNAALKIEGTAASPVLVTSSSATPAPGDWGSIDLQVGSLPSVISNANIVYGGAGQGANTGAVVVETGTTLLMTSTAVEESASFGVNVTGDANIQGFVGNTLAHNAGGPISLTANGVAGLGEGTYTPNPVEGIHVTVSQLSQNANWSNLGVPYVLGGLTVESVSNEAVLYVGQGTVFQMAQGSSLVVQKNGGLILDGTQQAPILVTSAQSPAARGDWADIEFFTNSLGSVNTINWTQVEYGGGTGAHTHANVNAVAQVWVETNSALQVNNSTFSNSSGCGVSLEPNVTLLSFAGNTMTKNASYPVQIDVDDVRQLQEFNNTYGPNDQTGIALSGSPLRRSTSWSNLGVNYFVQHTFDIDYGLTNGLTTLTLNPGTQITIADNQLVNITTQGEIIANGSDANAGQIQFNGQGAQPGDGSNWGTLNFLHYSELHYVRLRFGGETSVGMVFADGGTVLLDNVVMPELAAGSTFSALACRAGALVDINGQPFAPGVTTQTNGNFVHVGDPNIYCHDT